MQSFLTLCPQDNLEFSHFPEEETGLRKARPQVTYTVNAGAGADLESEHAGVQVVLVPAGYQYWKSWVWDGYRDRAGHGITGPVVCQKQAPRGDQEPFGVFGE